MNDREVHVEPTRHFRKRLRQLRKKYRHLNNDIQPVIDRLTQGETPGDQIQGTGYALYKVRIPSRDMQRGKSGGFRVIYYLKTATHILLITLYAKSEETDIAADILRQLIESAETEVEDTPPQES